MKQNTEIKVKVIENATLIARRVPPGDKWQLIANAPDGPVHKTLTDTLEAYMTTIFNIWRILIVYLTRSTDQ